MQTGTSVRIYGDSLMKGTVIDDAFRYHATMAQRLERLSERFGLRFQNRSRFGITAEKGLHLMEKDVAQGDVADYAMIEFGGNDCDFRWNEISERPAAEHAPAMPLELFAEALRKMVLLAQSAGTTPVMMSLPPLDAERYLNFLCRGDNCKENILQWLGDVQLIYRFHELYSRTAADVARSTGALFVDVRAQYLQRHDFHTLVGLDGIHQTPAGYELIYQTFEAFILRHTGRRQRAG